MRTPTGRLAPSPTGLLHAGHARTFHVAWKRAREAGGTLILRIEDLDPARSRPDWIAAAIEDLSWLGLDWDGAPVFQSQRRDAYLHAWRKLVRFGHVYPCRCSRKDVAASAAAPHERPGFPADEEPVYPGTCRPAAREMEPPTSPAGVNWRFRVPDGEEIVFDDARLGTLRAVAGRDFGDFIVWRRDDVPAYQLAVVVDDLHQAVTEVVRGEDLVLSTFRQLLIYRALAASPPAFYHTELVLDASGRRLAKRDAAHSIAALRQAGFTPAEILGTPRPRHPG